MTLKLLLAGKNTGNFQPIKNAFENADTTIITATSMALALYLARKNLPDIVICQQFLTDSDGINLYSELKNEAELEKIPFIFLVASAEQIDQTAKDIHWLSLSAGMENNDNGLYLKEQILQILKLYR